jgi:hypothetical protein
VEELVLDGLALLVDLAHDVSEGEEQMAVRRTTGPLEVNARADDPEIGLLKIDEPSV